LTDVPVKSRDRSKSGTDRPYRGPDRRSRVAGALAAMPPARVLPMSVMICLGAGLPALFLIPRQADSAMVTVYLQVAAGLLAVVAGATSLVSWRLVGRALQGWVGTGLVVLGVLTLFQSGLTSFGAGPSPAEATFEQLVIALVAGWFVWRGVTDAQVNAAFSPLVTLAVGIGSGVAALGALHLLQAHGMFPAWASGRSGHLVSYGLASVIWLAVAAASAWMARLREGVSNWLTCITVLVGLSLLVRMLSPVGWWPAVLASVLGFLAMAIALGVAMIRIQMVLRLEDRRELHLHDALVAGRRQAVTQREQMEEWLHDLRNSIAGLQAADAVLRAGSDEDLVARDKLAEAVTAELARLHVLVEPSRALRVTEVSLHGALSPVIAAERARGSRIIEDLGDLQVRADGEALTQVVQNLLENARRYAGGSSVTLSAAARGQEVEIMVSDEGPGIPRSERLAVFSRGVRGTRSEGTEGSGLGLFVCRELLGAMGGTIALAMDSPIGCRFVVTLPGAGLSEWAGLAHVRTPQPPSTRPGRLQSVS